jgi:peptidyl-prolyl cis-trans isomerase A (cyclophilin A)
MINQSKKFVLALSLLLGSTVIQNAQATIVQFQTVMGDFQVNLYDKATPKTVENFLAYVTSDAYKNTIMHRSIPNFVIQGGGFQYVENSPLAPIPQKPTVINEPIYANKRGTIAMAKIAGNPNSATNQWFFNLVDNRSALDDNNGGFTVFGEVMGNGMGILDSMAAVSIFNAGGAFGDLPLRNYTAADNTNGVAITDTHLILIENIVVLDANVDTAASLTPEKTTNVPKTNDGGGGGGNIGFLGLFMLLLMSVLIYKNNSAAKINSRK